MTQLLDLTKVVQHDTIRMLTSATDTIGKSFELINRAELGVYELYRIDELQQRITALQQAIGKRKSGKPTAKQQQDLLDIYAEFIRMLIPAAPDSAIALLPRAAREQIVIAWLASNFAAGAAEGEAASRRTTVAKSRGSRRSTAATRRRGSTSRSTR